MIGYDSVYLFSWDFEASVLCVSILSNPQMNESWLETTFSVCGPFSVGAAHLISLVDIKIEENNPTNI